MQERGVDHSKLNRGCSSMSRSWTSNSVRANVQSGRVGDWPSLMKHQGRLDVSVWAVDKAGATVDFLLTAKRDRERHTVSYARRSERTVDQRRLRSTGAVPTRRRLKAIPRLLMPERGLSMGPSRACVGCIAMPRVRAPLEAVRRARAFVASRRDLREDPQHVGRSGPGVREEPGRNRSHRRFHLLDAPTPATEDPINRPVHRREESFTTGRSKNV